MTPETDMRARSLERFIVPLIVLALLRLSGVDRLPLVGLLLGYLLFAWASVWSTPDEGLHADPVLAEREPDEENPRRYEPIRPS